MPFDKKVERKIEREYTSQGKTPKEAHHIADATLAKQERKKHLGC